MITQERDVEIDAVKRQGWTISAIARRTNLDLKTVRAYGNGDRQVGVRRRGEGRPDGHARARVAPPELSALKPAHGGQGFSGR